MTSDKTRLRKRSLSIAGHATSISLEDVFWDELALIAAAEDCSIASLVRRIDATRTGNLSSAVRVYVVERLRANASGSIPATTD